MQNMCKFRLLDEMQQQHCGAGMVGSVGIGQGDTGSVCSASCSVCSEAVSLSVNTCKSCPLTHDTGGRSGGGGAGCAFDTQTNDFSHEPLLVQNTNTGVPEQV